MLKVRFACVDAPELKQPLGARIQKLSALDDQ
jgi:endonuclease YncB( thermonuclease family)